MNAHTFAKVYLYFLEEREEQIKLQFENKVKAILPERLLEKIYGKRPRSASKKIWKEVFLESSSLLDWEWDACYKSTEDIIETIALLCPQKVPSLSLQEFCEGLPDSPRDRVQVVNVLEYWSQISIPMRLFHANLIFGKTFAKKTKEKEILEIPNKTGFFYLIYYNKRERTFTWGAKDKKGELVPIGHLSSGLTKGFLEELQKHVRDCTVKKFGPILSTKPLLCKLKWSKFEKSRRTKAGFRITDFEVESLGGDPEDSLSIAEWVDIISLEGRGFHGRTKQNSD